MKSNDVRAVKVYRVTWIGLVANFSLAAVKLAAGIIGQSGAMIADAVHSLSDFVTDIVIIVSFRIIRKPVDREHDYGHGKFETLATAFIVSRWSQDFLVGRQKDFSESLRFCAGPAGQYCFGHRCRTASVQTLRNRNVHLRTYRAGKRRLTRFEMKKPANIRAFLRVLCGE